MGLGEDYAVSLGDVVAHSVKHRIDNGFESRPETAARRSESYLLYAFVTKQNNLLLTQHLESKQTHCAMH